MRRPHRRHAWRDADDGYTRSTYLVVHRRVTDPQRRVRSQSKTRPKRLIIEPIRRQSCDLAPLLFPHGTRLLVKARHGPISLGHAFLLSAPARLVPTHGFDLGFHGYARAEPSDDRFRASTSNRSTP